MAVFIISSITNPTSSSSFEVGDSFTMTWTRTGSCNDWNVTDVKLQYYNGSSWSNVADLYNSSASVNGNSLSLTLPNSVSNYGDAYRLKVTYELGGFEP